MTLPLGRHGEPQFAQLLDQFVITQTLGFGGRLQNGLTFVRLCEKPPLLCSVLLQLRDPFG